MRPWPLLELWRRCGLYQTSIHSKIGTASLVAGDPPLLLDVLLRPFSSRRSFTSSSPLSGGQPVTMAAFVEVGSIRPVPKATRQRSRDPTRPARPASRKAGPARQLGDGTQAGVDEPSQFLPETANFLRFERMTPRGGGSQVAAPLKAYLVVEGPLVVRARRSVDGASRSPEDSAEAVSGGHGGARR